MRFDEAQAAAYLGGIIDGEGHVATRPNKFISVGNTDWDIIEAVVECCDVLGLPYRVNSMGKPRGNRKPAWQVIIRGKTAMELIRDVVPIRARRKQVALAEMIASYKQKPRPSREWVYQKYVVDELSLREVAQAWGCKTAASAQSWVNFYAIPHRTPAEGFRLAIERRRERAMKGA